MNTGKVKTTTNYSHELININRQVVSVEIISGLANFQFQVHVQLAAGKVLLVIDLCVGSPTSLAQHAHAHFHPSTTLLPSRDFPIQALLFPNSTSISFFIPPINTVFYLIERLIQYFILLNDCDKEQKKESLCRG